MKVNKNKSKTNPPAQSKKKPVPTAITCSHTGVSKVFTLGKSTWYAGSYYEAEDDFFKYDLLICLNGKRIHYPIMLNDAAEKLIPKTTHKNLFKTDTPTIEIEWEDFSVPNMPQDVWYDLIHLSKTKKLNILVYCQGGHGRTGTALAAIAYLSRLSNRPVTFIRKNYCEKAVESERQLNYLRNFGALVTEQNSSGYKGGYDYSAHGYEDLYVCDHPSCPESRCYQVGTKLPEPFTCKTPGCHMALYLEESKEEGYCHHCRNGGVETEEQKFTMQEVIEDMRDNDGKWVEETDDKGVPTGMWTKVSTGEVK